MGLAKESSSVHPITGSGIEGQSCQLHKVRKISHQLTFCSIKKPSRAAGLATACRVEVTSPSPPYNDLVQNNVLGM